MFLYLIQHGEAKSKEEDPDRSLNETGTANAKKTAAFLKRLGIKLPVIWHSGKNRAEQTAEILAEIVCGKECLEKCDGLSPTNDVAFTREELGRYKLPALAIVGHLPHLSRLASLLLTGSSIVEPVQFKNAGVVCLLKEGDSWKLQWAIAPDVVI